MTTEFWSDCRILVIWVKTESSYAAIVEDESSGVTWLLSNTLLVPSEIFRSKAITLHLQVEGILMVVILTATPHCYLNHFTSSSLTASSLTCPAFWCRPSRTCRAAGAAGRHRRRRRPSPRPAPGRCRYPAGEHLLGTVSVTHSFGLSNATRLTPNRPAMPFANRKISFRGSFQFSIVTIQKISPLWKPEIK